MFSEVVRGRNVTLEEVKQIAAASKEALYQSARSINREVIIYLHWSAGHYHQFYGDYHINIDADGSVYVTTENFAELKAHTWHRNSGAIGVAMACAAFATSNNLGDEPPTDMQIESMAQVIVCLAEALDIPIDAAHIMTHAEAANLDGYGPDATWERWDLWFLHNGEEPGSGGDILRGKANWYKQNGLGE
ncbi:peptidoglycan recognition protein family protein [Lucifera butyrica]|nr:N-acetylmuramoyl-L-alanine amidase [Lucifera butyrica]